MSGIFAYPVLGLLAGAGMLIKFTEIQSIKEHSESAKRGVALMKSLQYCETYNCDSISFAEQSGWQMKVAKEFTVTKQNVNARCTEINQEIDSLSGQYRKVYLSKEGAINGDRGQVTVQLMTLERV